MAEEIITETNRETATDHAYGGAQAPGYVYRLHR